MREQEILTEAFEKIKAYIKNNQDNSKPVVQFRTPAQLKEVINFKVEKKGVSESEFFEILDKYLEYSVRTGN
ncbi:MAG: hypothetical protein H5T24_06450, partial [Bacteroidales bacterium]|nr:hypothetical protein [Bacteroidales bacterium]